MERPSEELLAWRFSSVSRPAKCTAQLDADIKVLVHNARLQPTRSVPSDTCRFSSGAGILVCAGLSEVKAV